MLSILNIYYFYSMYSFPKTETSFIMNPRNKELEAIRDVANKYAEGCHTGDIALLRSIFHPQAMMYGVSGDNVVITPIEGLYAYLEANEPPQKTGEPHQCFITEIRYEAGAAVVELVQESAYGNDYTNYFQLLKVEGNWLIMSKSYSAIPTRRQVPAEEAMALHAS